MQKYDAFILFGAPGCGKGTQGRALGALPGFFYCACGDIFRSISTTTPLGRTVAEYSNRGELVPDSITVKLWKTHLDNCVQIRAFNPERDKLLLDGIPRNITQAHLLADSINIKALLNLWCSDRVELVARLCRRAVRENRLDDANENVIRHRLEVFELMSRPLLDFYGPKLVFNIDSQNPPMEVLFEILKQMRNIT